MHRRGKEARVSCIQAPPPFSPMLCNALHALTLHTQSLPLPHSVGGR